MPQELALYEEFTIEENMRFYGKLFSMSEELILQRCAELVAFLDLPDRNRVTRNLSGGQKRRVSLALALLHSPKLLILDEPTVGVDPLLRARIWDYLVELASKGTSIIITTHYIAEANQADTVGMMRGGKLLAEGRPDELMKMYKKETLEDVFLQLCVKQDANGGDSEKIAAYHQGMAQEERAAVARRLASKRGMAAVGSGGDEEMHAPLLESPTPSPQRPAPIANEQGRGLKTDMKLGVRAAGGAAADGAAAQAQAQAQAMASSRRMQLLDDPDLEEQPAEGNWCSTACPRRAQMGAMMYKALKRMQRNPAFLVFQFILPAFQVLLFCLAIGKDPTHLPFGIVNNDVGFNGTNLGSAFLDNLARTSFSRHYFSDPSVAYEQVHRGNIWGFVEVPQNFSRDFPLRFQGNVTLDIVRQSTVTLTLDMSNQQISSFVELSFQKAFTSLQNSMGFIGASSPLYIAPPVYGPANPKFTDFIAPGMIINIAFAQAIGLTAAVFVQDKHTGNMDRQWAAGVRAPEILLAQLFSQFIMLFFQICCLLVVALGIFRLPMVGDLALVVLLAMSLGLAGMMLGLTISASTEDEQKATQLALGTFFPTLLLSGVIWPLQGMPLPLRYVSYCLPTTWAADAMRSIMSRGWGMSYPEVWKGFLITWSWLTFLFFVSVRSLKAQVD